MYRIYNTSPPVSVIKHSGSAVGEMRVPPAGRNPLGFLKEHATAGPTLSCRRLLVAFCASAQALSLSERDFSSVGRTVTDMSTRLDENTVDAIELVRWGKRAGLIRC